MAKKRGRKKKFKNKASVKATVWLAKLAGRAISKAAHYSGKNIYKLGKYTYKKAKQKTEESKEKMKRPRSEPVCQPFRSIKTVRGDAKNFVKMLLDKSTIGIILGARGTGKSAIGMAILENVKAKTGRKTYAVGFNRTDMPRWINVVDDVAEIKNNSFVLIDEGGILLSSRESMNSVNKLVSNLMLVARHKDISILFITQNSSNIDINTLRQADFLVLKPSSLLQLDFERNRIKKIYAAAEADFKSLCGDQGLTYVYSDAFQGFVSNPLPSFWSTKISKSFKKKSVS